MASATSSIERLLAELMMNGTPTFAAARAVASSPSRCMMPCTPIGATRMGDLYFTPKSVVCACGFKRV